MGKTGSTATGERRPVVLAAVILAFVLIAVCTAVVMPGIVARGRMGKIVRLLEDGEAEYFIITDLYFQTALLPAEREVRVDGEDADAFSALLAEAAEGASYVGSKKNPVGNWDLRIRMYHSAGFYDIYVGEGMLYLTRGERNYYFEPEEGGASALEDIVSELFEAD